MNLNKAEIIGNLVQDPIVRTLPSGQSVSSFRVATNHTWKDSKTKEKKSSVEYHPVIAWGGLGHVVSKYLKKGDRVYIEGRLNTRSWEGKDKVKRNQTEIVANNMIMLGGAKGRTQKEEKVSDEVMIEEIDPSKVPVEK